MSEYRNPSFERAEQLSDEADALFTYELDASDKSDQYIVNTVYLATALVFGGIAGAVVGRPARTMIITIGIMMLTVPITLSPCQFRGRQYSAVVLRYWRLRKLSNCKGMTCA